MARSPRPPKGGDASGGKGTVPPGGGVVSNRPSGGRPGYGKVPGTGGGKPMPGMVKKRPMMGKPITKKKAVTSNGPKMGGKPRTARTVKGGRTMT